MSLTPVEGDTDTSNASSLSLPATSQYISVPSLASYVGRAQLSATLVVSDSLTSGVQAGTVLAEDGRDVHLLRCSSAGETIVDQASAGGSGSSSSCCLAHGFVTKTDAVGLSGIAGGSGAKLQSKRSSKDDGGTGSTAAGEASSAARRGGSRGTPRLAHFVFDVKGPPPRCSYFFFVAVRAAVRVLQPEMRPGGGVVVHFHYEPWGPWWAAIKVCLFVPWCPQPPACRVVCLPCLALLSVCTQLVTSQISQ